MYVSTRNKTNSYTAYRALHEEFAPDGGQFVPFHLRVYSPQELKELQEQSFSEIIAQILNLFFSARLTAWDVECCVGRNPVRIQQMSHRLLVAEVWHNTQGSYVGFERSIYSRLCDVADAGTPTQWARIAIYIALLFGLSRELASLDVKQVDVAVNTGDFALPMAAHYARQMGLNIGKIICACNENGAVWELIHKGEFNTNPPLYHTQLKDVDIPRPQGIEQLVYTTLGAEETSRYVQICNKSGVYRVKEEDTDQLSAGMFAAVVGSNRTQAIISSMYRTNQYLIDPYTALSYGGLQDYRSRTGGSQFALLISHGNPALYASDIAAAVGIGETELKARYSNNKE